MRHNKSYKYGGKFVNNLEVCLLNLCQIVGIYINHMATEIIYII